MTTQPVPAPETAIVREHQDLTASAQAVRVTSNDELVAAGEIGRALAGMEKRVCETFDPICDAAHKAWKAATTKRASFLDPLTAAKRHVAVAMAAYRDEQERKRRELQAKLEREQREREAAESERLRREAEDRQLLEAQAANDMGDAGLAEAILEAPTLVELPPPAPVVVASTVAPVVGASTRKAWKFKIVNGALIPREYLLIDETKIGGVVRAMKASTNIPGVVAYEEATTAFRS